MSLPALPSLERVQARLNLVFEETFPDRSILIGDMATRMVFVGLYGGFIEGTSRWFRPSTVIRFSEQQAALDGDPDRNKWLASCQAPGFVPNGTQWYADNTREPLRDDLIRNRCLPLGIVVKRDGVAITSPAPIYALSASFAALMDPALEGDQLTDTIEAWKAKNLDPMVLKRAKLIAKGAKAKDGKVSVTLPYTGQTLVLGHGEAAVITRDVCEVLAPLVCSTPVVVHVSHSDQKTFKELEEQCSIIELTLDKSAELPDVVIADIAHEKGFGLTFVEVVHSDGAITELRKKALLEIAHKAGIPPTAVNLVTAFDDRQSQAFRKRFSELAVGSSVWFRTEPEMLVQLAVMAPKN